MTRWPASNSVCERDSIGRIRNHVGPSLEYLSCRSFGPGALTPPEIASLFACGTSPSWALDRQAPSVVMGIRAETTRQGDRHG